MNESVFFEREHRINSAEADVKSLARPGALFVLMQELAGDHSTALGCGREELLKRDIVWMLSRIHIKMERYPALYETVRLRTWPGETGRVSYPRYFEFFDARGNRIGTAASTWVLASLSDRRLIVPKNSGVELKTDTSIPIPLEEAGRLRVDLSGASTVTRTPQYGDIDENGHMNNTRYIDWIADLFPLSRHQAGRISELSIHYAKELLPEVPVELHFKEEGNSFAVAGGANGTEAFEAVGRWTEL